jgi:hypothetical protein
MRIGFVQLPVPDHHAFYAAANRPLGAAYMIAFARRHCRRKHWEAEILPEDLANYGGDAAIVDWVGNGRFDALFFTLYLWNRDRSLFLARSVKRNWPEIVTVMGGPEVTGEQSMSDFPGADVLCVGEGEEFFARFLEEPALRLPESMYTAPEIDDLSQVPNPYLTGLLPVRQGDMIHFEQMRGCPQFCAYCYYGKGRSGIRRFPAGQVPGIFRLASAHDRTEVYFMDPTFNGREGLTDHLEWIAQSNPGQIPIHTEVRLELIDRPIADRMTAAGIRSVEAGLQSVNPRALAAVGRTWNREAFRQGARLLRERGIEIRTGVIIGLPKDGLDDFITTLEFVDTLGLALTMECYILAVLPGTALRRRLSPGWIQAMSRPPYLVRSTDRMNPEDFIAAIQILERRSHIEYFPGIPPFGTGNMAEFQTTIDLRVMDLDRDPERILRPTALANSVAVYIDERTAEHARLELWAGYLLSVSPHTCWRIIYAGNEPWPRQRWQRLRYLFLFLDHFLNRSRCLCRDFQGSYSVRLFQTVDDVRSAQRFLDFPQEADLVIIPQPGQVSDWEAVCRETPWILIDPLIAESERALVSDWYADFSSRILDPPLQ